MSSSQKTTGSFSRTAKSLALAGVTLLVLTACAEDSSARRGWLPGSRDTTSNTAEITDLWINSWIAAVAIGVLTWGLMLWCMVAYRRRKGETGYPRQLAYNVPLEIMYTVVPLIMVGVLFFYTDQVQRSIDDPYEEPDLTLEVYGKQWAWDLNYTYTADDGTEYEVHQADVQANLTGEEGVRETLPTIHLPGGPRRHLRAEVPRRHPLLLGAGLPAEARYGPRPHELHLPQPSGDRHLRRQVRRAVR